MNTDGSNADVGGKPKVEVVTLTTVRTTIIKECPVCGENMVFEKIERQKDGKKVSEELIKKDKHTVRECIREWQQQRMQEANYTVDAEICENCEYYVTDYWCCSDTIYCNHPDFTFEKTAKMIAFQKEFEKGEYEHARRSHDPTAVCKPYVDEAGRCDKFEQRKKRQRTFQSDRKDKHKV